MSSWFQADSRAARGFSLAEAVAAAAVLGVVAVGTAIYISGQDPASKNRVLQDNACLDVATSYMNKIGEWGLPRHSLHLMPSSSSMQMREGGLKRKVSTSEEMPGIDPDHQLPNYPLLEKGIGVTDPLRLRNAMLATGTMGALQAIYNSNLNFCTDPQGRAYAYVAATPGVSGQSAPPLIPNEVSEVAWRGGRAGRARIRMRITTYAINTGAGVGCPPIPLILQPQALTEPPEAYRPPNPVAERGGGVRNDLGFLVAINVTPEGTTEFKPCTLERKFQHQRLASVAAATPFAQETNMDDTPPTCAMPAALTGAHGNFTVDLKYLSRNEAKGSVLLCRDRSLRLKPALLDPDGEETALRLPTPLQRGDVESCITTGGVAGGLSNGQVNNCFVRRRPASTAAADFYQPSNAAEYALSRMGPTAANESFVACEELEICRINGVGRRPVAVQVSNNPRNTSDPADDELIYSLSFSLDKDHAGCFVHIETAQVDVAGNVFYGEYRRGFMSTGSPGAVSDGYCMDGNAAPLASNTAYANCDASLAGMGDGNCPCYTDRIRNAAGACVAVADGYYSVDDHAADDGGPVACTNGPNGAGPLTAAANNFIYTSSGRGGNNCDWDCATGYTKVSAPAACVLTATPTPTPLPDCSPVGSSYFWNGVNWDDGGAPNWNTMSVGFCLNCAPEVIFADRPLATGVVQRAPGTLLVCQPTATPTPTPAPTPSPTPCTYTQLCALNSPAKFVPYEGESLGYCNGDSTYASPGTCFIAQPSVGHQGACVGTCEDATFSCPSGSAPWGSGGLVSPHCYCLRSGEVWNGTSCVAGGEEEPVCSDIKPLHPTCANAVCCEWECNNSPSGPRWRCLQWRRSTDADCLSLANFCK